MSNSTRQASSLWVVLAALCACLTGCQTGGGFGNFFAWPRPRDQVLQESVTAAQPDARRKALYEMSSWRGADEGLVSLVGMGLLGDSDAMTRAQAARTLGAWGHSKGVRYLAVGLAGKMGDPGAAEPRDAAPELTGGRPAAAQSPEPGKAAQTQRNPAAATKPEENLSWPTLPDENKFVRVECAKALGRIAHGDGLQALDYSLKADSDVDVRVACAGALREIRRPEAARGLLPGLVDGDYAVQTTALESLRFMTGRDHGGDPAAWGKFLAEPGDPLAGYGHPPRIEPRAAQGTVEKKSTEKLREIFSDLFPLERKEGPFE